MNAARVVLALVGACAVVACGAQPSGAPVVAPPQHATTDAATSARPPRFAFGRAATPAEIAAWDIDVMPDGTGLPPGSGTAARGATLYAEKCAVCHGATGREGPFERLVGRQPRTGFPFGRDRALVKTIGNYWPYATTVYDYIQRAMPLDRPGSLTPDEVYSLVAFLLAENEVIPRDAVINAQTLPQVVMPARDRFVVDVRRGGVEIQ